jgi:apolipoprotein D and lipocalin family protein
MRVWLKRLGAVTAMAALLSCTAGTGAREALPLRNPTVPMGGTSRFDASALAGTWRALACIGPCAPAERYALAGDGKIARTAGLERETWKISAPGVLRRMGEPADRIVFMWIDEGYRTAVLGDAGGRWAVVLSRDGAPASDDRTKAAIEILDFNGWDTGKLRKIDE